MFSLLYSLCPHERVTRHSSNLIFKFTDNTTFVGQLTGNDVRVQEDNNNLIEWCQSNDFVLNLNRLLTSERESWGSVKLSSSKGQREQFHVPGHAYP